MRKYLHILLFLLYNILDNLCKEFDPWGDLMKKSIKERILQFLIRVGKKCKPLHYLVMVVMVVFLSIYHAVRKVIFDAKYHKLRTRIISGTVVAALVLTCVVWPSLAEEENGEPVMEVVEATEEPSPSPETTVEPLDSDEKDESDEAQTTEEPENTDDSTTIESPKPAATVSPDLAGAAEEDDGDGAEEEREKTPAVEMPTIKPSSHKSRKAVAARDADRVVEAPDIVTQPQEISSGLTYGFQETVKLSVEAEVKDKTHDILYYQWFVKENGVEKALTEQVTANDEYVIPNDISAGTYRYFCRLVSKDEKDRFNVSAPVDTNEIEIVIHKADPAASQFDTSELGSTYYYTGEEISLPLTLKKGIKGMGDYRYIFTKSNDFTKLTDFKDPGTYQVGIRIDDNGQNYAASDISLGQEITIKKIPTPSRPYTVSGTKGKKTDGIQWYTSAVRILPASGYTIGTSETGDFASELVYENDGRNVGPDKIYLKNSSGYITDAVTVDEKVNEELNIDQTNPAGEIRYGNDSVNQLLNTITFGAFFQNTVSVDIVGSDAMSGVDSCYYYRSDRELSQKELAGLSWQPGDSYSETPESKHSKFIVYGKIVDKAGNIGYISSDGIVIDGEVPEITCEGSVPNASYVADKKHFKVTDENLKEVSVSVGNVPQITLKGKDIKDGVAEFTLTGPEGTDRTPKTYTITAVDGAQNTNTITVSLSNPIYDISVQEPEFGVGDAAVTYGYEAIEPKAIEVSQGPDANTDVSVDRIEVEQGEFEVVSNDPTDGFTIRPKQKLSVGDYTGVVRIYYNGSAGSTTTVKCHVEIKKAILNVSYEGQVAYYHTIPDFTEHIIIPEGELKNGDTLETLKQDPAYEAPVIRYEDAAGTPKPAMEDVQLIPESTVGKATNYAFQYTGGWLTVKRRALPDGYQILGDRGTNGWYTSPVVIEPKEGYLLSTSEEADTFGRTSLTFDTDTMGETASFYIMNEATGEISNRMEELIKIDTTGPVLAEGEGINISNDLWNSFVNTVTFGMYFNDTKSVSISGSDDGSGMDAIYYYLSKGAALTEDGIRALDDSAWTKYSASFTLSPAELDEVVVYAKLTNKAGLSTYISSDGMIFDNKGPDIEVVVDGQEYITEEKEITISDRNLEEATLYEGTDTTVSGSALKVEENVSKVTIPCPEEGSKTYTIVARDVADNLSEKTFTITKPIYDIEADRLVIGAAAYGYGDDSAIPVTWKNTKQANADATVSEVIVSDTKHFQVKKSQGEYTIVPVSGLHAGKYRTDVKLIYNGGKEADTTCSFTVEKAILTARYMGQDVYYHMTPDFASAIEVTGFVNGETAETASGYEAPAIAFKGTATETKALTPSGGKADDYQFIYSQGVLIVSRREAETGTAGQYEIQGRLSDTGWYTSDITIKPDEGYSLAFDEQGQDVAENIILTKDTDSGEQRYYLMNDQTGEIYERTVFDYKKDAVAPAITGVKDGETYQTNSREVTVRDAYLANVTVNGAAQEVTNGVSKFTLSADQTNTVYVIVATDRAGNISNSTIVLKQPSALSVDDGDTDTDTGKTPVPTAAPDSQEGKKSDGTAGTVKKKVMVVEGAPETMISTSNSEIASSVLTDGEQLAVAKGSNANVELRIQNIDSSVSQADKELIIANIGGYTVGQYLDITLWKTVGSGTAKKVHTTNKPIAVTITIPEELRNSDSSCKRSYAVFRVHNGAVTLLEDQDSVSNTITISTDKFSTYVLAYKDARTTGGEQEESSEGSGFSPDMGDTAPIIPVAVVLLAALAGIIIVLRIRKKNQ